MGQELTTANKILVAASHLSELNDTFTAEELIVRAWTQFPESFGLSGYRDRYPDSNRVLSKLMGTVGLCSRGWLEQVSTKIYRITPGGRKLAKVLREGVPSNDATPEKPVSPVPVPVRAPAASVPESVAPPCVAPPCVAPPSVVPKASAPVRAAFDESKTLQRLLASSASQKFTRGAMVTFADACVFWGITPASQYGHLTARTVEIESVLKRAEQEIQSTGQPLHLNDTLDVTLTAVIGLQGLHRMLRQKYQREIEQIRTRTGTDDD